MEEIEGEKWLTKILEGHIQGLLGDFEVLKQRKIELLDSLIEESSHDSAIKDVLRQKVRRDLNR